MLELPTDVMGYPVTVYYHLEDEHKQVVREEQAIVPNEDGSAEWVFSAFESVKQLKNPQTVKQATVWNKVGGKVATGFSLFK